jgi:hypothetical protein
VGSAVHVPSKHVVKSVHVLGVSVFGSQHPVLVMDFHMQCAAFPWQAALVSWD